MKILGKKYVSFIALVILFALLVGVPGYLSTYTVILITNVLMNVVLTLSWAIFSGPTRYISLASAAFFGTGVYASALLSVISRGAFGSMSGMIPGLGASGAIFGIMAAYLFLYSDQRILTLILPIPWPFWIPAWIYIVRELLLNALVGQLVQEGSLMVTVNVFAHLGGAVGGLLFIYFFLHPDVFAQRR